MVGQTTYTEDEIKFLLGKFIDGVDQPAISQAYLEEFGKKLTETQVRYVRNKYGKDPNYGTAMINVAMLRKRKRKAAPAPRAEAKPPTPESEPEAKRARKESPRVKAEVAVKSEPKSDMSTMDWPLRHPLDMEVQSQQTLLPQVPQQQDHMPQSHMSQHNQMPQQAQQQDQTYQQDQLPQSYHQGEISQQSQICQQTQLQQLPQQPQQTQPSLPYSPLHLQYPLQPQFVLPSSSSMAAPALDAPPALQPQDSQHQHHYNNNQHQMANLWDADASDIGNFSFGNGSTSMGVGYVAQNGHQQVQVQAQVQQQQQQPQQHQQQQPHHDFAFFNQPGQNMSPPYPQQSMSQPASAFSAAQDYGQLLLNQPPEQFLPLGNNNNSNNDLSPAGAHQPTDGLDLWQDSSSVQQQHQQQQQEQYQQHQQQQLQQAHHEPPLNPPYAQPYAIPHFDNPVQRHDDYVPSPLQHTSQGLTALDGPCVSSNTSSSSSASISYPPAVAAHVPPQQQQQQQQPSKLIPCSHLISHHHQASAAEPPQVAVVVPDQTLNDALTATLDSCLLFADGDYPPDGPEHGHDDPYDHGHLDPRARPAVVVGSVAEQEREVLATLYPGFESSTVPATATLTMTSVGGGAAAVADTQVHLQPDDTIDPKLLADMYAIPQLQRGLTGTPEEEEPRTPGATMGGALGNRL